MLRIRSCCSSVLLTGTHTAFISLVGDFRTPRPSPCPSPSLPVCRDLTLATAPDLRPLPEDLPYSQGSGLRRPGETPGEPQPVCVLLGHALQGQRKRGDTEKGRAGEGNGKEKRQGGTLGQGAFKKELSLPKQRDATWGRRPQKGAYTSKHK